MKPFVLWLMGPTSSGKTTLAEYFVSRWRGENVPVIHYDGDEVRDFFGRDHGFRPEDRMRVVGTLIHLSKKANAAGLNVVVSALTANPEARASVAKELDNLVTGYVDCPIEICAERDPKGLYAKAKTGEIETLIGWNTPYDPPQNPDIVLSTNNQQTDELFAIANNFLCDR
jgi:adenylylsulfate kinase